MTADHDPRILSAERLNRGIVIAFDDGRCALFLDALLYATLPQAEELDERKVEW